MSLKQLFSAVQQIEGLLNGLTKDVDPADSREETKQDMEGLNKQFDEVRTVFGKMEGSDLQDISSEVQQLLQGKQSFVEYIRDVTNIVNKIKERADKDPQAKQKLDEHTPQGQGINQLLGNYSNILNQLSSWSQQRERR